MKAGENSNGVSIGYGIIMPTNGQYSEFESSKDYIIAILESVKIENFDQADQAF
jgi:hypothetical protein